MCHARPGVARIRSGTHKETHDERSAPSGLLAGQRSRASRILLAAGTAGAVAARLTIGRLGVMQVVLGTAGSLFLGQRAFALVFLAALAESTARLGLLLRD